MFNDGSRVIAAMSSVRCSGMRKSGRERCKLQRKPDSNGVAYCSHHQGQRCAPSLPLKLENCPICMDDINPDDDTNLKCGHSIHINCTKKLHDKICPMCRKPLVSDKLSSKDIDIMAGRKEADRIERESVLDIGGLVMRGNINILGIGGGSAAGNEISINDIMQILMLIETGNS